MVSQRLFITAWTAKASVSLKSISESGIRQSIITPHSAKTVSAYDQSLVWRSHNLQDYQDPANIHRSDNQPPFRLFQSASLPGPENRSIRREECTLKQRVQKHKF